MTHQQPRGDGDDVAQGVPGGQVIRGIRDVAEDAPVDDGSKDEVDVADQDQG